MKFIIISISLVLYSLFFAEWFLRFLNPQALMPRYIQASEYGIRENIPNAEYRHWTPEVHVQMQTNSQGMRDYREYDRKKPEGVCRVAIFGDSFFMGYEVSWEHSYAGQLEVQLKNAGQPCEVLNFAVSGFGTAESLIALEEKALSFEPDYVVLEWHHTDPVDNLRSGLFTFSDSGELQATGKSYLPGVKVREKLMRYRFYRWAIEYSHLYSMVREKVAGFIKELLVGLRQFNASKKAAPESVASKSIALSKPDINIALINRFCAVASINNASCILADMPSQQFNGDIDTSLRLIDTSKVKADAIVTPIKLFEQQWDAGYDLFRYEGHRHFNELGYSLAASVASDYIISQQ